jgi:hypothetical protein
LSYRSAERPCFKVWKLTDYCLKGAFKMAHDNPQSRNEAALQNMVGEQNELSTPLSRVETILQDMLGAEYEIPDPLSRNEELLIEVLNQGGGGGGTDGVQECFDIGLELFYSVTIDGVEV